MLKVDKFGTFCSTSGQCDLIDFHSSISTILDRYQRVHMRVRDSVLCRTLHCRRVSSVWEEALIVHLARSRQSHVLILCALLYTKASINPNHYPLKTTLGTTKNPSNQTVPS